MLVAAVAAATVASTAFIVRRSQLRETMGSTMSITGSAAVRWTACPGVLSAVALLALIALGVWIFGSFALRLGGLLLFLLGLVGLLQGTTTALLVVVIGGVAWLGGHWRSPTSIMCSGPRSRSDCLRRRSCRGSTRRAAGASRPCRAMACSPVAWRGRFVS